MKFTIILMNMEKNWSYKVPDGPHAGTTLWSGRYCAIAAFVFKFKVPKFKGWFYIIIPVLALIGIILLLVIK